MEYKILAVEGWQWIERGSWDEDTYIVLAPYSNTLAGAHTLTLCRIFLKFPDQPCLKADFVVIVTTGCEYDVSNVVIPDFYIKVGEEETQTFSTETECGTGYFRIPESYSWLSWPSGESIRVAPVSPYETGEYLVTFEMTGLVNYPSASGYQTQFKVTITPNCETGLGIRPVKIGDFVVNVKSEE